VVDDLSVELSRQDMTHLSLDLADGTGSLSVPLVRSGSVARIVSPPLDIGSGYLRELIVLSNGANTALMLIGQEKTNPADISFTFATWSRVNGSVTASGFVGEWDATYFGNPYLQSSGTVFTESREALNISRVDDDTITVTFQGDALTLDIVDGRATLVGAPVTVNDRVFHSLTIQCDGQGLSFYVVKTGLNTATNVSVGVGLATH